MFSGWRIDGGKTGRRDPGLHVLDLVTFQLSLLMKGTIGAKLLWSPDSRWLAVSQSSGRPRDHRISLVDVEERKIVETGFEGVGACFTPDSKQILFKMGSG